jgi:DNA-binding MarR family transcriptional regulator
MTIYGIAKALGTRTGAVKSVLDSMCADSLLRVRPGERGQLYALTSKGRAALRRADEAAPARIALPVGTRVLLVVDEGRAIAPGLLEQLADEPELRWSARLDGLIRWVAVFESSDAAVVDRAAALVEAAGGRPARGRAALSAG